MPLRARIRSLWRSLAHGDRLDDELDEELRAYLDELIIRNVRAGLDLTASRRQAQMEIGRVEAVKDDVRNARVGHALELTMQDHSSSSCSPRCWHPGCRRVRRPASVRAKRFPVKAPSEAHDRAPIPLDRRGRLDNVRFRALVRLPVHRPANPILPVERVLKRL